MKAISVRLPEGRWPKAGGPSCHATGSATHWHPAPSAKSWSLMAQQSLDLAWLNCTAGLIVAGRFPKQRFLSTAPDSSLPTCSMSGTKCVQSKAQHPVNTCVCILLLERLCKHVCLRKSRQVHMKQIYVAEVHTRRANN